MRGLFELEVMIVHEGAMLIREEKGRIDRLVMAIIAGM